jgi:hypothetical protein
MRFLILTFCTFAMGASGADIYTFSLLPSSGNLQGAPGSTAGFGYSIQNQSSSFWLVTTALNSDSFQNASPHVIFDFPSLAPGGTATEPYDSATHTGLFEVTWNASAPIGSTDSGNFVLSAEWWNGDPLGNGSFVSTAPDSIQPYSVTAVPEPATFGLAGLVLICSLTTRVARRQRAG